MRVEIFETIEEAQAKAVSLLSDHNSKEDIVETPVLCPDGIESPLSAIRKYKNTETGDLAIMGLTFDKSRPFLLLFMDGGERRDLALEYIEDFPN